MNRRSLPILNCNDCGACCLHMRSPPHIVFLVDGVFQPQGADEFGDYAHLMAAPEEATQAIIAGLGGGRPDESPCSWLDLESKKCRWHGHRPDVCRAYEVGEKACLAERKEHRIGMPPKKRYQLAGGKVVTCQ